MSTTSLVVVIALLGAGTYGLRLGGVLLARRVTRAGTAPESNAGPTINVGPATGAAAAPGRGAGERITRLLPYAAVALLAALSATAAVTESGHFAGIARPTGVAVGLVAGLLRAPFAVAVVLAAAVAAGLRLLGVP